MPPNYEHVFERDRLFKLVEQRKMIKMIWVNGAPGSGKTVFIASLLKKQQASFLWYRIDIGENNFADIFYFLALAAQKNYPRQKLKLPVFTSEYADDVENFAHVFFRELFALLTQESAIVLDNCQELEKDAIFLRLLQIAINQLPDGMQLICISRNHLSAALKRLHLNNELLEIGDIELQFNELESYAFMKWLNPQLEDHQIHHIQSKTQGWAVGMVLMARQFATPGFPGDFSPTENIFHYLASEILAHLPKELHACLVASALFTQFTAEMATHLTGCRQTSSHLDELVSKNFLIERTASSTPAYRFYPLFRDLLLTQADTLFTPENWQELQYKAAAILVKQGNSAEATLLYQKLQDWPSLKTLLLQQAEQLINSGRYHTLNQWMKALPSEYLDTDAWLNYWHAAALKPTEPLLAEQRLEESYQKFVINHDVKGIYSAWVAAVESIAISWDDFSKLKVWMSRFDEILKRYACPSIELRIQFYATAVNSFSVYNPQHPWLQNLIRVCERVFRFIPIKTSKILLSIQLAQYYIFNYQLSKLNTVAPFLELALEDEDLSVMVRIMSAYLLVIQGLLTADTVKGLKYTHKGLELSKKSGIHLFERALLINIVGCHINDSDLISAENALQKAIQSRNNRQRIPVLMHYSYVVWLAALAGDLQYALEQNQQALQLAELIHFKIAYVAFWSLEVQILAELSQWQKAEQMLSLLAAATAKDITNKHNQIQYYVADAWLAYLQQNQRRTLAAIKELLRIMHTEKAFTFFGWRPKVLTPLCLLAIENSIEEEFAVCLLKQLRLLVSPPLYLEKWPWPVRIYSFGSLVIQVEGKQLEQSGKSQKKILELLEALIILGGRNVHYIQLTDILWPDVDGDLARQSLETALHRLRKLLGKEAVILSSGLISLNSSYCWLDLWVFEATVDKLEQALNDGQQSEIIKLTDRLLKLYRGTFLKNFDSGPGILKQYQLLNKLSRMLDLSINFHEKNGEYDRVCLLLTKGIELKPLTEAYYRQLMSHYIRHEQFDQALQTYHQCHRVLFEGFKVRLSNEILELAKQLKRGKQ
ncbi:BTAD domain-containing putative transcriptional regulator [Nitrosomonas sp. Nm33]|uniref:BTAD domain-containing putative transcriptional regulator n=1 Tax=Nitrosomonas sp. Nm33 TaxID=133724 RepID=UPI000895E4B3|nr:BTAD domain-containing putative transcriptional regulator [Nitrosomonas sp. Nm33]SDY93134.1 transcriptional activator domain-containing protein [Nitrosomonas sp. Nm33]